MKLALQGRLLLSLFALLCFGLLLVEAYLVNDANRHLGEFRSAQAEYQAKTLAYASLDALVAEDFELMERWIASAMPSDDYAYAALARPDGQVLTHTDQAMIGGHVAAYNNSRHGRLRQTKYAGRPVMEAVYPAAVGKRHLANAYVAYYLDVGERMLGDRYVVYDSAGIMLFTFLILGTGTWVITRRITGPLKKLAQLMSNVSLERGIEIDSSILKRHDEVGALARTFETMSGRIVKTHRALALKTRELEQRVRERTHELSDANEQLRSADSRIRAIMEYAADAIVSVDSRGVIETYNRVAERMFGYTAEEAIGRNINILMPESNREQHDVSIRGYPQSDKNKMVGAGHREVAGRHKSGTTFPLEIAVNEIDLGPQRLFIAIMRDISERKARVDKLRYAAEHDSLTGLYNRSYFEQELERVVERLKRGQGGFCALLYIDLDNFKQVNDTLGHAAGDRTLVEVTDIIRGRVRKADVVARMGGDEFCVLIYDTDRKKAEKIADEFRRQIADHVFPDEVATANLGCSVGVVVLPKGGRESTHDLLARADWACYRAKRGGRNQVHVFDPAQDNDYSTLSDVTG